MCARLRRRGAPLGDQPRNGALGHVDAKLQELTVDSRGAPERIRGGHSYDKALDLSIDRRAAHGGPARELGPILTEATPPPAEDGLGVRITRGCLHAAQTRASAIQKNLSPERSFGRDTVRL